MSDREQLLKAIAEATAFIRMDTSGFQEGGHQVETTLSGMDRATGKTGSNFKQLRQDMGTVGIRMAAAGGAIAIGLKAAFDAASDLTEQTTKMNYTFGSSAHLFDEWKKNSAEALGMSYRTAIGFASSFGVIFQSIGYGQEQAAVFSKQLVELATDIGSFYNVDPSEVVQKLQSGLVGQARPLRQYGILLSEAAVSQEALKESGKTAVSQLTEQDRVIARLNIIMRDSKIAQGDWARTQHNAANEVRIMTSEIDNMAAAIGVTLLPAGITAAHSIATLAHSISELPQPLLQAGTYAATAAAAFLVFAGTTLKVVSITSGFIEVLGRLNTNMLLTSRAMVFLTSAWAPWLLVAAAAIAVGYRLIQQHREHAQTLKDLTAAIKGANDAYQQYILGGQGPQAAAQKQVIDAQKQITDQIKSQTDAIKARRTAYLESKGILADVSDLTAVQIAGGQSQQGQEVKAYLQSLQTELAHTTVDAKELTEAINLMTGIIAMPGVDINRVMEIFQQDIEGILAGTLDPSVLLGDLKEVQANIGQFAGDLEDTGKAEETTAERTARLTEELAKQNKQTRDQVDLQRMANEQYLKGTDLLLPYTRNMEDVQKATESFNDDLKKQADNIAETSAGYKGLSGDLLNIRARYGGASESIYRFLLNADKLGDINLGIDEKQAYMAADALAQTDKAIQGVTDQIHQNADDISMWQDRIDFLDDTIGTSEDTLNDWNAALANGTVTQQEYNDAISSGKAHEAYSRLNELVNTGRISQTEANDILAKGIWLRERATGGILDERAEQAKLIPALAQYVHLHDQQAGTIERLSQADRGRIAALQDENVQSGLQLAIMVKFLEAAGQISPKYSTQLLLDLSQFNPALRGVLEDYKLIPDKKDTEVTATVKPGTAAGATDTTPIIKPTIDMSAVDKAIAQSKDNAAVAGEDAGHAYSSGLNTGLTSEIPTIQVLGETAASALGLAQIKAQAEGVVVGHSFVDGLISAIASSGDLLASWGGWAGGRVSGGARMQLREASPSRDAEDIGDNWTQGLALGVAHTHHIDAAMRGIGRYFDKSWGDSRGLGAQVGGAVGGSGRGPVHPQVIVVEPKGGRAQPLSVNNTFNGVTNPDQLANKVMTSIESAVVRLGMQTSKRGG